MTRFLCRRIIYNLLVMVGVLAVVDLLLLSTGDPARALLPIDALPEQVVALRHTLGLDDPFPIQFAKYLWRAVRADFGYSYRHNAPALDLVLERAPATLRLGAASLALSLAIGLPLGALSAIRKGTRIDHAARLVAAFGQAIPEFWLGLMLLLIFGVRLGWLPISGSGGISHLVMPAIVISMPALPGIVRIFRSSVIDVLERDYVRTARAKGLTGGEVFRAHVAKNSAIPVLTIISFEVGHVLSGALIAEVIFAYPGMGRLAYEGILNRDLVVVQVVVIVISAVVVTTNMVLDLCYALLDPRVRVQ